MYNFLLLMPLLVAALLLFVLFLCGVKFKGDSKRGSNREDSFWNKLIKFVALDVEPLFKQPVFWFFLIMPLCYIFLMAYFIFKGSSVEVSKGGVAFFLKGMEGLWPMVAITVASIALIARMHATVQSARQIAIATDNQDMDRASKDFDNFVRHEGFLHDIMSGFESEERVYHKEKLSTICLEVRLNKAGLYRQMFPCNGPRSFSVELSKEFEKGLSEKIPLALSLAQLKELEIEDLPSKLEEYDQWLRSKADMLTEWSNETADFADKLLRKVLEGSVDFIRWSPGQYGSNPAGVLKLSVAAIHDFVGIMDRANYARTNSNALIMAWLMDFEEQAGASLAANEVVLDLQRTFSEKVKSHIGSMSQGQQSEYRVVSLETKNKLDASFKIEKDRILEKLKEAWYKREQLIEWANEAGTKRGGEGD